MFYIPLSSKLITGLLVVSGYLDNIIKNDNMSLYYFNYNKLLLVFLLELVKVLYVISFSDDLEMFWLVCVVALSGLMSTLYIQIAFHS